MFSYVQTQSKSTTCNPYGLPYVWQHESTIPEGTDLADAGVGAWYPAVDGGPELPAPLYNLSVTIDGCDDYIMRVEYMDTGSDCDPCNDPDAVSLGYAYYYVNACEARSFANGLYVDVDLLVIPNALRTGDPAADYAAVAAAALGTDGVTTQDSSVRVYGDRATNNCCALPEVTNTRGAVLPASTG